MVLLLALLSPIASYAEITFYVAPEGDKGFSVEADDIDGQARVELTVIYDSSILANPRASVDGGTVADLIDSNPGTLIFNAIQGDDPGPSFVAHLKFDRAGDTPGGIFSVKGRIIEKDGAITPSRSLSDSSAPSLLAWTSSDGESEEPRGADEKAIARSGALTRTEAEKSVLQRFREFRGERNLQALAALFAANQGGMLVQEPMVVLSDGKSPVSIRLASDEETSETPNFALSDAKLLRLRKDDEKGWVITVLPNEGTWSARLIMETDKKRIEFPLAVAPPVKINWEMTESDFVAELDKFGAGRMAEENDPRRKALYEYFFTANYLASQEHRVKEKASLQARVMGCTTN